MKYCLTLVFFFTVFAANAQRSERENPDYVFAYDDAIWNCDFQRDDNTEINVSTDFFGNQTKTFKDANGHVFRSIKRSQDILGKLTTTVSDDRGHTILEVQCATDILGKESVKIIGDDFKQLGYMTTRTDILGAKTTVIRDEVHDKTTTITRSTDIFGNQQIKINGPRNNFYQMLTSFVNERIN